MSSSRPKTVQIYLPDGNARSVRVAEITSRTVQATEIPRQKLQWAGELRPIVSAFTSYSATRETTPLSQTPTEPYIPETMLAELQDNFGTVQPLLSVLGFPILDPLVSAGRKDEGHEVLYCQGKGAEATCEYTEDGLVVRPP